MKTSNALAAVLLIGSVVGPAAFAQTATTPNSGAAVPGMGGGMMGGLERWTGATGAMTGIRVASSPVQ
jgi:hypothetical protein